MLRSRGKIWSWLEYMHPSMVLLFFQMLMMPCITPVFALPLELEAHLSPILSLSFAFNSTTSPHSIPQNIVYEPQLTPTAIAISLPSDLNNVQEQHSSTRIARRNDDIFRLCDAIPLNSGSWTLTMDMFVKKMVFEMDNINSNRIRNGDSYGNATATLLEMEKLKIHELMKQWKDLKKSLEKSRHVLQKYFKELEAVSSLDAPTSSPDSSRQSFDTWLQFHTERIIASPCHNIRGTGVGENVNSNNNNSCERVDQVDTKPGKSIEFRLLDYTITSQLLKSTHVKLMEQVRLVSFVTRDSNGSQTTNGLLTELSVQAMNDLEWGLDEFKLHQGFNMCVFDAEEEQTNLFGNGGTNPLLTVHQSTNQSFRVYEADRKIQQIMGNGVGARDESRLKVKLEKRMVKNPDLSFDRRRFKPHYELESFEVILHTNDTQLHHLSKRGPTHTRWSNLSFQFNRPKESSFCSHTTPTSNHLRKRETLKQSSSPSPHTEPAPNRPRYRHLPPRRPLPTPIPGPKPESHSSSLPTQQQPPQHSSPSTDTNRQNGRTHSIASHPIEIFADDEGEEILTNGKISGRDIFAVSFSKIVIYKIKSGRWDSTSSLLPSLLQTHLQSSPTNNDLQRLMENFFNINSGILRRRWEYLIIGYDVEVRFGVRDDERSCFEKEGVVRFHKGSGVLLARVFKQMQL